MSRLRVALAKGRLYEPSVERFRRAGAAPAPDAGRRLLIPSSDPAIEFLVVKPGDVPVYVESGAADLGVTGTDVLRETGADVLEPLELGFGFCRLVVAAPADAPYPALPGGITARVATKYPRLAQAHFGAAGRPVDIIQVTARSRWRRCSTCRTGSWTWWIRGTRCGPTAWWSGRRCCSAARCWWPTARRRSSSWTRIWI